MNNETEFTREIEFTPAFDRRSPEPAKNYGIHGVDMRCYLKGAKGAVQFILYTDWHLPNVRQDFEAKHGYHYSMGPTPADLGYHSPVPMYEGQEPMTESCELLNGKPCYYDGSGLNANDIFDTLVHKGGDAMWSALEDYYREIFGGKS